MSSPSFDLKNFVENPSLEKLKGNIRKQEWKDIATHFSITFTERMNKEVLKNHVIETLVKEQMIHFYIARGYVPVTSIGCQGVGQATSGHSRKLLPPDQK